MLRWEILAGVLPYVGSKLSKVLGVGTQPGNIRFIKEAEIDIRANCRCSNILFGTKRDKRDFLPCYYQACELPKMSGLEVAKLLSTAA